MSEDQIKEYLKNRGCPEFVWRGSSENLLRRWKDFVEQVEKGYCANCLIQEYWNDLDIRELIHYVGIENTVTELDQRFTEMLTATDIKH
jgi:hypothetical protein